MLILQLTCGNKLTGGNRRCNLYKRLNFHLKVRVQTIEGNGVIFNWYMEAKFSSTKVFIIKIIVFYYITYNLSKCNNHIIIVTFLSSNLIRLDRFT